MNNMGIGELPSQSAWPHDDEFELEQPPAEPAMMPPSEARIQSGRSTLIDFGA
jgi:hypothetical protein